MAAALNSIRRARPLLGTFVEIEAVGPKPETNAAIDAAYAAIVDAHRLMSFHEPGSDVSRLNRDAFAHPVEVHDWTFEVLKVAVELHATSGGVFDIDVAATLQMMGLLPLHDGECAAAPEARSFDSIELLAGRRVRFRSAGVRIDLGGIAKGFAVDRALEAMRRFEVSGGMVNAGGDLAAFGSRQMIHVRDPCAPQRAICSIAVRDEALASSARRFDPHFSAATTDPAIIDPVAGLPADGIHGVTVRAPTCMIADALTKVVMITGADAGDLLERHGAGAVLIGDDGLQITSNLHQAVHLAA